MPKSVAGDGTVRRAFDKRRPILAMPPAVPPVLFLHHHAGCVLDDDYGRAVMLVAVQLPEQAVAVLRHHRQIQLIPRGQVSEGEIPLADTTENPTLKSFHVIDAAALRSSTPCVPRWRRRFSASRADSRAESGRALSRARPQFGIEHPKIARPTIARFRHRGRLILCIRMHDFHHIPQAYLSLFESARKSSGLNRCHDYPDTDNMASALGLAPA